MYTINLYNYSYTSILATLLCFNILQDTLPLFYIFYFKGNCLKNQQFEFKTLSCFLKKN